MNDGWSLLWCDNYFNGSLGHVNDLREEMAREADVNDSICPEPLFDLEIFGGDPNDSLLSCFPLAIPYFNHWYLLLGKDKTSFEYVVKWIAKIAKNPGDMSNICGLIFYSQTQGIEKSLAIKMTMALFTPFTEETQSVEIIFEQFSDLVEFMILLHIEDAPQRQLS